MAMLRMDQLRMDMLRGPNPGGSGGPLCPRRERRSVSVDFMPSSRVGVDMAGSFRFEYRPGTILYGREAIAGLDEELARADCSRALVVCGRTVGVTESVIGPVTGGLGDRLAGVFDRTTPEKYLATAVEGAERVAETGADAVVGLGGGSSLDTAKLVSVLASHDRPADDAAREMVADGEVHLPGGDLLPIVAVPTTLAGADLSMVAGTRLALDPDTPDEEVEAAGVSDPGLMQAVAAYDPALFATTPRSVLVESAMNGFNKGIEMVYARDHTAITDATAVHGLRLLRRGLPTLGPDGGEQNLADIVRGIVLVQYGLSTESAYRASLIHAFGHGFSRRYDATQGVAHATLAPHVLRYLFGEVDARRNLLAEAFDVDADAPEAVADTIVERVTTVRDAMGLPARLRRIDGLKQSHFPEIVDAILADSFMANTPPDLDPTAEEIESVLRAAW